MHLVAIPPASHPHPTLAIMAGEVARTGPGQGGTTPPNRTGQKRASHLHPTLTIKDRNAVTSTDTAPKIAKVG